MSKILLLSLLGAGLVPAQDTGMPATATVDFSDARQTIDGFGGAIAFYNGWVTAHPNKQEIYKAIFDPTDGLGISILRLQNLFRYQPSAKFDSDGAEFAAQANSVRGTPMTILMSSWSPPAAIKSNQAEGCPGTKNCTLSSKDGSIDYAGFANYWADSINAYRAAGVNPDFVSIQNEPDWIADYGSCKFNPTESTENGILYAGYDRALDAVYRQFQTLDAPPKLVGPEVLGIGYNVVQRYMQPLDDSHLAAVAHHLYHGGDEKHPDTFNASLAALQKAYSGKKRFETEYGRGSAFETAWIIQNSLTVEEASAYLYWSLVWPDDQQLIYIDFPWDRTRWKTERGWSYNDQYFAMKHFSYFIHPGFRRFAMTADHPALRVSAFVGPDQNRFVAVLINTSATETVTASLAAGDFTALPYSVYRTTFSSGERFVKIDAPTDGSAVTLGPQSVATVVIDR